MITRRQARKQLGSRNQRRSNTKLRGAVMEPNKAKAPDPRVRRPSVRSRVSAILAAEVA